MAYENGRMNLEIEHDPRDDSVMIRLLGPRGELFIVAYFEQKLEELLRAIIAIQDAVDETNYQEYIRRLLPICPLFVDTGEDLVPLMDGPGLM